MHFSWLGPIRAPVRAKAFELLRSLITAEEGRRILWQVQPKFLAAPSLNVPMSLLEESPYRRQASASITAKSGPAPIFVTARYRTGSTLVWNLFRHHPGCTAYYEPFNTRRWFDPSSRGTGIDVTHSGVTDYWREYEGLDHLQRWFSADWSQRDLYLPAGAPAPGMRDYVQAMVQQVRTVSVLQFNDIDFRLPWFRQTFPEARVLHLIRNPREQWCSTLVDARRVPRNVTVDEFRAFDHFYLLSWAGDLSYPFPFLSPARHEHPYDIFYLLWRLSYLFGRTFADASFAYEDLLRSPDSEVARWFLAAGLDPQRAPNARDLVRGSAPRSQEWAPSTWFDEREAACDEMLARELRSAGCLIPDARADRVARREAV